MPAIITAKDNVSTLKDGETTQYFQIVKKGKDSHPEIPDEFWSFEVFTREDAERWIKENGKEWELYPVKPGDIEDQTVRDIYPEQHYPGCICLDCNSDPSLDLKDYIGD